MVLFLLACMGTAFAQGDFRLSEQMFSRIHQNPSGIGNNEKMQIFTATRLQWVGQGVETNPTSALLNLHYYNEKLKSGFGFSFIYDELGLANQTINAKICYAYNIDLTETMLLSLGLSAGVVNKRFDPARHIARDPDDPNIPTEVTSVTNFDLDFGLELSWQYLMGGFSITHLPNLSKEVSSLTAPSHINLYLRGNVPLPMKFNLIPAVLYTNIGALNKYTLSQQAGEEAANKINSENSIEYSVTAMYDGKYWLGLGYRSGVAGSYSNNQVTIMAGFEWHWLRVGYACDISLDSYKYDGSTHEIMLSFVIPVTRPIVWQ